MSTKGKIALTATFVTLALAIMAASGLFFYAIKSLEALDTFRPKARDAFELKAGTTATKAAMDLTDGQFSEYVVRYWISQHKELQAIQRGTYRINGEMTLAEVMGEMVSGHVIEKEYPKLALIEGSSWHEFLPALEKLRPRAEDLRQLKETPRKFIKDTLGEDFLTFLAANPADFEGLLMPATYLVVDGRPATAVIKKAMVDMAAFLREVWPERDSAALEQLTPYEALIMASIIERETLLDEERPKVAAVFYNRLRAKMRLQTDPAVMYGIDPLFRGRLTKKMLTDDTPYNTYTRQGLPPTPIAMPGRPSILAALHPADDKSLYFVAKGVSPKDGHTFSATLEDHNKAVAEYRKKVKEYKSSQNTDSDGKGAGTSGN